MALEIHPKAAENFNKKGDDLVAKVVADPYAKPSDRRSALGSETVVRKVKVDAVISPSYTGHTGEVAKTFNTPEGNMGLFGEGYTELAALAEAIQKLPFFKSTVSRKSLIDLSFMWVESRFKGNADLTLMVFLQDEYSKRVRQIEVCIPVYGLQIPHEITIGDVTLRTLTKSLLDPWHGAILEQISRDTPDRLESNLVMLDQERAQLQGYAIACVLINAEPIKAEEVAFEKAGKAINLLRFFTVANRTLHVTSYTVLYGRQHREANIFYTLTDGRITAYSEHDVDHSLSIWVITTEDLAEYEWMGLQSISTLLALDILTEFQESLLASLLLYSQCTLKRVAADKLIQILVAVEAFFLKDNTEPINKNIGERMAFLFKVWTTDERQKLVSTVSSVYNLRSSYIHHGKPIGNSEMALIEEFMVYVWLSFQTLIASHDKYKTRLDLFKELDARKFA